MPLVQELQELACVEACEITSYAAHSTDMAELYTLTCNVIFVGERWIPLSVIWVQWRKAVAAETRKLTPGFKSLETCPFFGGLS